jgi:hypothetical protein
MANEIYRFEEVVENPAGFSLNKRVRAVYRLEGFIHETLRNGADAGEALPRWLYIGRGGVLSGLESTVSLGDLEQRIACNDFSASGEAHSLGRLYLGLHTRAGQKLEKDSVIQEISTQLYSFTATAALGCREGAVEPGLVVTVGAVDFDLLWQAASHLREKFDQEAVGIEWAGAYHRVTGKEAEA